eukprot:354192-Chlamydomonas_euryale.AAC.5
MAWWGRVCMPGMRTQPQELCKRLPQPPYRVWSAVSPSPLGGGGAVATLAQFASPYQAARRPRASPQPGTPADDERPGRAARARPR